MTDADSRKRCICLHCGGHHGSLECPPTDHSELVKRLEREAVFQYGGNKHCEPEEPCPSCRRGDLLTEAAEAIERLAKNNADLIVEGEHRALALDAEVVKAVAERDAAAGLLRETLHHIGIDCSSQNLKQQALDFLAALKGGDDE